MKRTLLRMISMVMSVLLLSACAAGGASSNSLLSIPQTSELVFSEPSSSTEITMTDICGRQVTLPKPAERVVLTFSFEEYFAVTGEEGVSKVVGWARKYWEGRRQSSWDMFTQKFPQLEDLPDVGYVPSGTFNVESVIALEPDLVLMVKNDFENVQTDLERLEQAGIPVLFVDYHMQTMENHCNSTLLIGKAMGMEERAEQLVKFYQTQMALVTDRLAQAEETLDRPKVYVEFSEAAGPATFGASYGKQMWGALVEQCGGDNIARSLVEGASAPIMPEQVLACNPDITIFAGNQFADSDINIGLGYTSDREIAEQNLQTYAQRPGWSELNAVKNGRMYALYHDLSRHIFDFAGLQFFAKTIHPDLFEDLDPDAALREFHEKFYPVEYTGTWFLGLEE